MHKPPVKAIFVAYRGHLAKNPGGVQKCTQEYLSIIRATGIELDLVPLDPDRRLSTRIRSRIMPSPYFRNVSIPSSKEFLRLAKGTAPQIIFLNQVSLAPLAPELRACIPSSCKIVVLSHGLESTDLFHLIRMKPSLPLSGRVGPMPAYTLGSVILRESALRADVDLVCTISEFDEQFENWIGAKRAGWLPRIINPCPLVWRPDQDRLGYVGTLDHAPNLEGLTAILEELQKMSTAALRIRVVGGPPQTGQWLAHKYKIVDYLGPLDDKSLRKEASSWNAFLHPIFCYARGCSTKLAAAIEWHLPIITTKAGHRGYRWSAGNLIAADNAKEFARNCVAILDPEQACRARMDVIDVARSSPGLDDVAGAMRRLLDI